MISPKLPLIVAPEILTATKINHIISRTEYAARLLQEYNCIAGNKILIEKTALGKRISYSVEEEKNIYAVGIYFDSSILGYKAFLYNIASGAFEDFLVDGFTSITPYAIQNGTIVGSCVDTNGSLLGFKYTKDQFETFSYNNNTSINTYFRGIFAENIVGYSQEFLPSPIIILTNGFLFNGLNYEIINYETPSDFRVNTIPSGIYNNLVVGEYNNSNQVRPFIPLKVGFTYNINTSEFVVLNPFDSLSGPSSVQVRAAGIYENNIVGVVYNKIPGYFGVGYLYDGNTYEQIIYPSKFYTEPTCIYENIIGGFFADDENLSPTFAFIYQNNEFKKVQYENSTETYIYGIGVLT